MDRRRVMSEGVMVGVVVGTIIECSALSQS